MVQLYHGDSVGSPFRGSYYYYTAKIIEVHTVTDGRKMYAVKYDDNVIEENVKYRNTTKTLK